MNSLEGKRIGIAAERKAEVISKMIRNKGGIPVIYPLQGMQHLNEDTSRKNIYDFLEKPFDWVVLTTGIGAVTLEKAAKTAGVHKEFFTKLHETKLAVRGKKTMQWLKENSLQAERVSSDGTMESLLSAFSADSTQGDIFLQAYNQDDARLKDSLDHLGHSVYLSQPYHYEKPLTEVIRSLKFDIADLYLDTVLFTSKTQVRNLFKDDTDRKTLVKAFNHKVLAAAIGKVTAGELSAQGITDVLQPVDSKMGAMVVAIDHHYRQGNSR
ncbi:uroporphyrinogen-III synthase [Thalassobacillus cyri]|uniref:Uroporphyrinogen-III synthase n=1 Tax=Thalassobacillus cyri TaxID=571932 RepID=A0A1H4HH23_9BACI|nr:uroporphyrinogen-III synthase [Thalassobacillus cyri]SEB21114.1 uroporphyrinogen-III synthase [Thalassobacillus cyri]